MEEIDYGSHACRSGKIAVRHKIQFGYEHLLRRKKALVASAIAQTGIKRTVVRTIDFPPGYTTVTAIVEIAPGTCSGRHTHPGIDSGYVIQGDFVLKIDGKPEQTIKAGESYETSPQTPHDACSISGDKLIDTFVIEKGKPLASPAP